MDGTIIPASSSRTGRAFPWIVGFVCLAVFLFLHVGNHVEVVRLAARRRPAMMPAEGLGRYAAGLAVMFGAIYGAFTLASGAIAAKTRDKILWMLPALILVFSPLPARMLLGEGPSVRPFVDYLQPWGWPAWLCALVDLVLVLLPGAVVAARVPTALRRADGHQRLATVLVASFGLVVFLIRRYGEAGMVDVDVVAHLHLGLLFMVGVALGVRSPWFPAVHVLVAALVSDAVPALAGLVMFQDVAVGPVELMRALAPPLAAVGLGALSDPLAMYLRTRRERFGLGAAGEAV